MFRYLAVLLFALIILSFGCRSVARFPMDEPSADYANDKLLGKWKVEEDTDKNNYFEIVRRSGDKYKARYWNRGGTNPTYEGHVFFSKINNVLFLNVPYWHQNADAGKDYPGYIFLRVVNTNMDNSRMTTAVVSDTSIGGLASQLDVYNRIAKNLNNKAYYSDTMHFVKVQ
jgi:hypothetical protein